VDGIDYPLTDYPTAQIEMLEAEGYRSDADNAEFLEELERAPWDSVTALHREYQLNSALTDAGVVKVYVVGTAMEATVGYSDVRVPEIATWLENEDGILVPNEAMDERLRWLTYHPGNIVWVRRADTGDGILLPQMVYCVAFTDSMKEAAFLAQFPEIAA
jgi:hypothetical protein